MASSVADAPVTQGRDNRRRPVDSRPGATVASPVGSSSSTQILLKKAILQTELQRAAQLHCRQLTAGLAQKSKTTGRHPGRSGYLASSPRSHVIRTREALEGIKHEVERIDQTVRALLDRSRPRVAASKMCSITEVAYRAVILARSQIAGSAVNNHRVAIEFEAPSDSIVILFDPAQIEDAILNLIINAIEATEGTGLIHVRISRAQSSLDSQEEVVVEVIDDGRGIGKDDLTKIFHPFFTTRTGGTGLGLPAVRRIARGHGGRIEVESSPGKGSRFTLHLPMAH